MSECAPNSGAEWLKKMGVISYNHTPNPFIDT